jgi:hypothetical protein
MINKRTKLVMMAFAFFLLLQAVQVPAAITEKIDVDSVWSAHPVDFSIVTLLPQQQQYVVYYDKNRKMKIAKRSLSSTLWQYKTLPSTTEWDSHDYVTMAVDDSGYIHVSGNMHNVPLVYFRSAKPMSVDSFATAPMTGSNETTVTYPLFIKNPLTGELFFQYRDNSDGTSITTWNKYSVATKKWTRITTQGFFNTEGEYSAYMTTPELGPDGYFHVVWMWRGTPNANTNHALSHIRSPDLLNWETMAGAKLTLPITRSTPGVVVDPVTTGNGLINISFNIGWDSQNRAVIGYHKYQYLNSDTISQRWNARWETDKWAIYQTSNWTSYKWILDLGGTLPINVSANPLRIDFAKRLVQEYHHVNFGDKMWVLNESTLKPIKDTLPALIPGIDSLNKVTSTFPGMIVHIHSDGEYNLRWETLPENQDQPRTGTLPAPNILSVYKIENSTPVKEVSSANKLKNQQMKTIIIGNKLTIQIPDLKNPTARLFTLNGDELNHAYHVVGQSIVFRSLPKGCYLFKVESESGLKEYRMRIVVR